jgi:hypothetical protein
VLRRRDHVNGQKHFDRAVVFGFLRSRRSVGKKNLVHASGASVNTSITALITRWAKGFWSEPPVNP